MNLSTYCVMQGMMSICHAINYLHEGGYVFCFDLLVGLSVGSISPKTMSEYCREILKDTVTVTVTVTQALLLRLLLIDWGLITVLCILVPVNWTDYLWHDVDLDLNSWVCFHCVYAVKLICTGNLAIMEQVLQWENHCGKFPVALLLSFLASIFCQNCSRLGLVPQNFLILCG